VLAQLPVGSRRISMGLQTFDEGFLRRMGRERFGDAKFVGKLVRRCRKLGIATSGDLLFNLPGQTPAQMDKDVDTAVGAGLDQICLYHLVLYEGLGTPWSKDPALLAQLPDNARACDQWLRLRERLMAAGYTQSTLTNFERSDVGERCFGGAHRWAGGGAAQPQHLRQPGAGSGPEAAAPKEPRRPALVRRGPDARV
jgi:oxygen-independent coproporphyrinogen-3 oxidase